MNLSESAPGPVPAAPTAGGIINRLKGMGPLRLSLATLSVFIIALAPFSGGQTSYEGSALLTTIVAPALFVIVAFLLPLDMIMTMVFRSDATGEERARLGRTVLIEGVLFVIVVAAWYPFMNRMLSL